MLLAFELSGEHKTIPVSEVLSCLEILNADFKVHLALDGCLVIDLISGAGSLVEALSRRLAMTHHIIEVLGIGGPGEEDILEVVKNVNIEFEGTYSIRVKRVKEYSNINTEKMEQRIGGVFYRRGFIVNLENPEIKLRMLLTEDKSIFGIVSGSINRSRFESRKPHYKPFFYPGVLMPRIALALVNLSKPEKYLLDPFCGTGGILVEAGFIGLEAIGGDVQRKLLLGARMNLDYYNASYSLMYQDACRMALHDESVDAVVTDPPYGRSAAIRAESLGNLLSGSLQEIYRVLKKDKRAVFISEREIEGIAEDAGFKVIEVHLHRVHKSLTRRICVLEK
ncbi:MAG: RNA methyltransferase [Candidatus Methanoperedens sp.]|nr:RNA methyltransferase [Candidatus Methanoperedens sp.]